MGIIKLGAGAGSGGVSQPKTTKKGGALKTTSMGVISPSSSASDSMWEDAPVELTRRSVILDIYGDTGTGRTSLALTAPGPIAYFHCDEKVEGVIQPRAREKTIRVHNFGGEFWGDSDDISRQAYEKWAQFKAAWYDAFTWARTIVLDTHTEAWELVRYAYFGALKPVEGRLELNWGPPNADWQSVIKFARSHENTNVVLIGQTSDEYKKTANSRMGEKTGKTVEAGQKKLVGRTSFWLDVKVRTFASLKGEFLCKVEKPWWNGDMMGAEFEGELMQFPLIMGMISQTDPDEWAV